MGAYLGAYFQKLGAHRFLPPGSTHAPLSWRPSGVPPLSKPTRAKIRGTGRFPAWAGQGFEHPPPDRRTHRLAMPRQCRRAEFQPVPAPLFSFFFFPFPSGYVLFCRGHRGQIRKTRLTHCHHLENLSPVGHRGHGLSTGDTGDKSHNSQLIHKGFPCFLGKDPYDAGFGSLPGGGVHRFVNFA